MRTPAILAATMLSMSCANAQPAPSQSDQCGHYVEAYRADAEHYTPYLGITADVARSRDLQVGTDK